MRSLSDLHGDIEEGAVHRIQHDRSSSQPSRQILGCFGRINIFCGSLPQLYRIDYMDRAGTVAHAPNSSDNRLKWRANRETCCAYVLGSAVRLLALVQAIGGSSSQSPNRHALHAARGRHEFLRHRSMRRSQLRHNGIAGTIVSIGELIASLPAR